MGRPRIAVGVVAGLAGTWAAMEACLGAWGTASGSSQLGATSAATALLAVSATLLPSWRIVLAAGTILLGYTAYKIWWATNGDGADDYLDSILPMFVLPLAVVPLLLASLVNASRLRRIVAERPGPSPRARRTFRRR